MLYEVFTGEIPFENPEIKLLAYDDFIEGVQRGVIRPFIPITVPEWLALLFRRCWSSDIDHRPTAADVLEELEQQYSVACAEIVPLATEGSLADIV
mgnify:CR=1 FL=1